MPTSLLSRAEGGPRILVSLFLPPRLSHFLLHTLMCPPGLCAYIFPLLTHPRNTCILRSLLARGGAGALCCVSVYLCMRLRARSKLSGVFLSFLVRTCLLSSLSLCPNLPQITKFLTFLTLPPLPPNFTRVYWSRRTNGREWLSWAEQEGG